jgi:D-3-phosphoglycerate dehydrogenase / 2-oxoglutarate reductase
VEAWGQRLDIELEDHITLFRYRDLPGMLGRVGTAFGEQGVNIISAAVGRLPDDDMAAEEGQLAAMAITTSSPVRPDVVRRIASSEGFVAGRTVAL